MSKTISLVMIVKNEEKNLARSLNSVKSMVDEMIIVDTGSEDSTKEIAQSLGAKVYDFSWVNDFSSARNFGIDCSSGDWILSLDADEYFDRDFGESLRQFIDKGEQIGRINIKSRFLRDGQERIAQADISRIFPRHVRFYGAIHEQLKSDLPRVDTKIHVLHDGYYESNKFDRNIPLLLSELSKNANDPYLLFQLAKEYKGNNDTKLAEQYYSLGYEQTILGQRPSYVVEAIVDYLYVLLTNRNLHRAMEIIEFESTKLRTTPDFYFVSALIYMEMAITNPTEAVHLLTKIEQSYLTCLKLGEQKQKEIVLGTSTYLASYNLGIFYEMMNKHDKAIYCYRQSATLGYTPAIERLHNL